MERWPGMLWSSGSSRTLSSGPSQPQAAEKSFEGLLAWYDVPFRKRHDLGLLGALASKSGAGLTTSRKVHETIRSLPPEEIPGGTTREEAAP